MQRTNEQGRRLPAEWEPQDAVLLAWPHVGTDWAPYLAETEAVYLELATAIGRFETVVIAAPDTGAVQSTLGRRVAPDRLRLFAVPTNDTWARDFGPITVRLGDRPLLVDFNFTAWGGKFDARLDAQITSVLHGKGAFGATIREHVDLALEGGSIESDGKGTLLTTSTCLLNPNRNPDQGPADIESALMKHLGVNRVLWLKHGHLAGDDTDAHIDTLVRFAPNDTLLYVRCPDPTDWHFASLRAMEGELLALRTTDGRPYRLLPLPWPRARHETDGHRLPATYANFLIINGAVLVPTYGDPHDSAAMDVLARAFPDRQILGIDCSVLIRQHGSLHCVTMQLPKGVLR